MKRHYIFASHGSFANGLLNSVELILGKQPDIHTFVPTWKKRPI